MAGLRGLRVADFTNRMDEHFAWPKVKPIVINTTDYRPMAPVWQNEGTNDGTIAIVDNYEEAQCRQNPEDELWKSRLTLWHGDVKTIIRLRSMQAMRMETAERAYDTKQWIMPVLGLWHLRFNLLKLIHRTHWGGSFPPEQSCLQYAADAWNRSNVNVPNDFAKLEELLTHSYQARILALLLENSEQVFIRPEDAEAWIKRLSEKDLENRVNAVIDAFNPPKTDANDESFSQNEAWFNHQCFVRHMNVYFQLRYSIKFADIGLLRQALRDVCVIFQAKEGKCDNYAPELLRVLQMVDSQASQIKLQDAILSNMLVNLAGDPDKNFEVDRLVEFLNKLVSTTKRDRLNSTKPLDELLREITLTAPYMLQLKRAIEKQFGKPRKGNHPPKDAAEDIWTMVKDLHAEDYQQRNKDGFSVYLVTDLIRGGFQNLGENVVKHNEKLRAGTTALNEVMIDECPETIDERQCDDNTTILNTNVDEEMQRLMEEAF